MKNVEIAQRYFGAMGARDFDAAALLLAADAEVITPDGTYTGSEFLASLRDWPGLDNLDISSRDRVLTEEQGVVASRATRVFTWKESGEVAYEQPSEARLTIVAGRIVRLESG
jgi:ketosteroid isomerase-like protein